MLNHLEMRENQHEQFNRLGPRIHLNSFLFSTDSFSQVKFAICIIFFKGNFWMFFFDNLDLLFFFGSEFFGFLCFRRSLIIYIYRYILEYHTT